jgi:hypothetical protein
LLRSLRRCRWSCRFWCCRGWRRQCGRKAHQFAQQFRDLLRRRPAAAAAAGASWWRGGTTVSAWRSTGWLPAFGDIESGESVVVGLVEIHTVLCEFPDDIEIPGLSRLMQQ